MQYNNVQTDWQRFTTLLSAGIINGFTGKSGTVTEPKHGPNRLARQRRTVIPATLPQSWMCIPWASLVERMIAAGRYFPVILQLLPMDRAIYGRSFTQRWYLWQKTLNLYGKNFKKNARSRLTPEGMEEHPDLQGRAVCFRDFVGHRRRMYDDSGHGTHVCGILCGNGRLSGGRYRGMAPGARLAVGKVLDWKGDGSTEAMLEGLDWVLRIRREYGIRIVNISVGIGSLEEQGKETALRDKVEELWASGLLVVCAAGNKGPGDGSISAVGGGSVVTVGCYDGSYALGNPRSCELYSGRGMSGSLIRKPNLVAPGTDIVSCNLNHRNHYGRAGTLYVAKSGTSMATPVVSGAAALAFQKFPDMTNEECKQKLQFTATDLGLPWNRQGWGLLNVERLLDR